MHFLLNGAAIYNEDSTQILSLSIILALQNERLDWICVLMCSNNNGVHN